MLLIGKKNGIFYMISLFYLTLPWDIWHLEQDVDLALLLIVVKDWEQDRVQRKNRIGNHS